MFNQLNNWSSDLEASGVPCVFLGKDTLFPDEMLWLSTRCFETDSFGVVICVSTDEAEGSLGMQD